jgi:hypothetical protein
MLDSRIPTLLGLLCDSLLRLELKVYCTWIKVVEGMIHLGFQGEKSVDVVVVFDTDKIKIYYKLFSTLSDDCDIVETPEQALTSIIVHMVKNYG